MHHLQSQQQVIFIVILSFNQLVIFNLVTSNLAHREHWQRESTCVSYDFQMKCSNVWNGRWKFVKSLWTFIFLLLFLITLQTNRFVFFYKWTWELVRCHTTMHLFLFLSVITCMILEHIFNFYFYSHDCISFFYY